MPINHRGLAVEGPYKNKDLDSFSTKTGGGGKKPPKKPPTKTGGLPDKDPNWDSDKNSSINPMSFMSIGSNYFDEAARSDQKARDNYMTWQNYNKTNKKNKKDGY